MSKVFLRGRPLADLELSSEERAYLERQVRRHRVARSLSDRCRIVLKCAEGLPGKLVAAELGVSENTVGKWRRRFLQDRIDGLYDEARPGRPRTIGDDEVAAVIERTLRTTPADATHWSIRSMATEAGYSHTTIRRMWNAFGLQPHRSQTFKLSSDPLFVDKVRDIVGLYLSPPTHALVLSVDEKSQIQALDRAQPILPMMPGIPERWTHNYATHKTPAIKAWLARRPHWHIHFTPTSGSWINQVERWFAELTRKKLQRGVHTSTGQLEADVRSFIERHNENPAPFKWTRSADEILAAVKRFCHKTEQTLSNEL